MSRSNAMSNNWHPVIPNITDPELIPLESEQAEILDACPAPNFFQQYRTIIIAVVIIIVIIIIGVYFYMRRTKSNAKEESPPKPSVDKVNIDELRSLREARKKAKQENNNELAPESVNFEPNYFAQQAPMQQAPMQQAPIRQVPVQQVPVQQVPVQQAPVQQAPAQQVSDDMDDLIASLDN